MAERTERYHMMEMVQADVDPVASEVEDVKYTELHLSSESEQSSGRNMAERIERYHMMEMVTLDLYPVASEAEDIKYTELHQSSMSEQSSGSNMVERTERYHMMEMVQADVYPVASEAEDIKYTELHLSSLSEQFSGRNMAERTERYHMMEMVQADVDPEDSETEDVESEAEDMEYTELHLSLELEQSSDDEDCPTPRKRACLGKEETPLTARDGTAWREEQLGMRLNFSPIAAYAADGEPTPMARRRITSRLQSFLCLVNVAMLQSVLKATVAHGKAADPDWFMPLPELMAFIAIVILRGLIKLPALRDYWSAPLGHQRIKDLMPRERFKDIMRHLRFDDKSTRAERIKTDRFAAISELWGSFVKNCIAFYTPGRHITIDEQLFPTKTRCPFLRYIATKPDKFGIKFWVACDLQTKYICNVMPYVGKDQTRPTGERLADNVVMTLMEPFLDKGRNVTTDNFFTSLKLVQLLHGRNTTILGTVNKIRREIPPAARETGFPLYTTKLFSTTGATLTVYQSKPKRTVYILSSMHSVVDCENSEKKKPSTITDYNTAKCGVDVMDQMVRDYSVRQGTRRWPVSVFYNMIDMAALNAHVLYQGCTGKKERRADFIDQLATELANAHVTKKEAKKEQELRKQPSTLSSGKRATCQVKHSCTSNRTDKQCAGCHKYTCGRCIHQRPWTCHFCG